MRGSAAVGGRPTFFVVRGPLRGVVFSSLCPGGAREIVGPQGLEARIVESVERVVETRGEGMVRRARLRYRQINGMTA